MSMDIHTRPGETVVFANPTAGMEHDRLRADKHLVCGSHYIIRKIRVHDWNTEVWLDGFKKPFNSVMFDNLLKDEKDKAGCHHNSPS